MLNSRFSLVIYFIHSSVYISVLISHFIPPLLPLWGPYICSLHLCLYFCLTKRFICWNKIIFETLSISFVVVCKRPTGLPQPPNCGIIAVLMGGACGHGGRQTGMFLRAETSGLRAWSPSSHLAPAACDWG